ncbi:hypothetical protein BBJ28_00023401, partial [Nothophytophthora sp. Chile5]
APGIVTDDTVVESFGEEHQTNSTTLDFTIRQIVRRYEAADRIVIAWRALIAPKTFKDMDLTSIRFEEKGALVLEPRNPLQAADSEAATIVRMWQVVTPELPDREGSELNRNKVHELTEFVLHACKPRAVQSMERTLRQQAMQSMLTAALSFLDRYESGEDDDSRAAPEASALSTAAAVSSRPGDAKKTRNYNPNRARETQRAELLALRSLVPQLEQRVARLREKTGMETRRQPTLWRKLASHQRQTRVNAEGENGQLRELVREQAELMARLVQQLPSSIQQLHRSYCWCRSPAPIAPGDWTAFKTLAASIDAVYHQVNRLLGSAESGTEQYDHASTTLQILPFDAQATGTAAWAYFAHSLGRHTTRFYYPADSTQSSSLGTFDTIAESYGVATCINSIEAEFQIKQIIRRYVARDRIVVAWVASIEPSTFKGEVVRGLRFEEKGAFVIEPHPKGHVEHQLHQNPAAAIRTWQTAIPELSASEWSSRGGHEHELTEFVLNATKPNSIVVNMERTLRLQAVLTAQ